MVGRVSLDDSGWRIWLSPIMQTFHQSRFLRKEKQRMRNALMHEIPKQILCSFLH